jgi:hypothetical protein
MASLKATSLRDVAARAIGRVNIRASAAAEFGRQRAALFQPLLAMPAEHLPPLPQSPLMFICV